jgi:hypothetical protein
MDCINVESAAARSAFEWPATERELHSYLDTVACAVDLANRGRVRDGYAYLLAGAMEAGATARCSSWGGALHQRYSEAITSFRSHFPQLPPAPELEPVGAHYCEY